MFKGEFWRGLPGFFVLSIVIVVVWSLWMYFLPRYFQASDIDPGKVSLEPGTFGDMFGGLTALFSGLAFAGLISTLLMQSRELQLQREELSQTREVFRTQRFENTLFGVLKLFNDHTASIEYVQRSAMTDRKEVGRLALEMMSQRLPNGWAKIEEADSVTGLKFAKNRALTAVELVAEYDRLYRSAYEVHMGPYFRLLYNLFRMIDEEDFLVAPEEQVEIRRHYARLVRAHLSSSEVKFLLFNCASSFGEKLRPFAIRFALLKHLPEEDRSEYKMLCATYPKEAFALSSG